MRHPIRASLALMAIGCLAVAAETVFVERFQGKLGDGWRWLREQPDAWRISPGGLEVRMLPGNMWGPPNNARNVLVYSLPDAATNAVTVAARLENRPTEQYEQVDLVWYYDDSHMVKIGQELVDGKLSLVMGREEADRTRTIAILPLEGSVVEVRFRVLDGTIRGQYRPLAKGEWRDAGECSLPANGRPNASLQCYQGPAREERWARISEFRVEPLRP